MKAILLLAVLYSGSSVRAVEPSPTPTPAIAVPTPDPTPSPAVIATPPPATTASAPVPAEPAKHAVVRGGALVGLNLANVSLDPHSSTDSKTGYAIGPAIDFRIGHVYLEIDALSSQYGYVIPGTPDTVVSYDAIDVPITAKYRFDIGEFPLHPFLQGGSSIAIRIKNEAQSGNTITDVSKKSQPVFSSFVLGAGLELAVTSSGDDCIVLGARQLLGSSDASSVTNISVKQSTLQFIFGYVGGF